MKNRESHFTEVLMARRENKERAIEDKWTFDYTKPGGPHAYEVTFQNIIDQPWKDFLREQKEKQGSTAAMDFMGGGSCFDNLPIDKKLAIRLLDKIAQGLYEPSPKSELRNVEVIAGDVLSKNTWKKVFAWVEKETQGRGFDLILSRPIGGLMEDMPRNIDVYYFLIEKLWEFLNKNNGTLYTQLPVIAGIPHKENLLEKKIKAWVQMLAGINNFGAKFSNNEGLPGIHDVNSVLRLRKTPNSPLRLPTLEDFNKALK